MTQIAITGIPIPLNLEVGSALELSDDELFELCARNRELRIERTAEGDLIVMTPAGGASSHRNAEITRALGDWAAADGTGLVFDSSAGFLLPNGAMRGPDAAWILRSRLETLPAETKERFLPLVPDFVVELRSPTDRLATLQGKMEEYRDNGARLGWLVDPVERRIHVYRPGRPVDVLDQPREVSGEPELTGFVLPLESIWAPL
jgi:Uma2 family endonuclease